MKKYNDYMCAPLLVIVLMTGTLFSMEHDMRGQQEPQKKIIDLNINLLHAVNNYREHCGRIKHESGYDPLAVFRIFMWRNANDNDLVMVGPSNNKQIIRYSSLRLAMQTCMYNKTLSYDEILNEICTYCER